MFIHKMVYHVTIKNHIFLEHSVSRGNVHDIIFKIETMEIYLHGMTQFCKIHTQTHTLTNN